MIQGEGLHVLLLEFVDALQEIALEDAKERIEAGGSPGWLMEDLHTLGLFGGMQERQLVEGYLGHSEPGVRSTAALSLFAMGVPEVENLLLARRMEERDPSVRMDLQAMLAELGSVGSQEAMNVARYGQDVEVKAMARRSQWVVDSLAQIRQKNMRQATEGVG